jgi:hypothetical protein
MRRNARVDANHARIVAALKKCGATVQSLATVGMGCPDLLVGWNGRTILMELKDGTKPPSARGLTTLQEKWISQWCGSSVVIVTDELGAINALKNV